MYFSQSGQLKKILDKVTEPLVQAGHSIEWAQIEPEPAFPFPWTSDQFFDAFPETFMGIPCKLKPLQTKQTEAYDLVILGYSPWYLSPSIPMTSFLQTSQAKDLLRNSKVITVIGCRNMWLMSQEKIKKYLKSLGADLVGNIVRRDTSSNLVSIVTIIRWLIKGKQEATRWFPRAGVSQQDIDHSVVFGECIVDSLQRNEFDDLQEHLNAKGAVKIFSSLILFERNGSKIFKMWASKILKKGPYGDPRRKISHRMFKIYLLVVLFVVSPIGNFVYFFIKLFIKAKVKRDVQYFSHNSLCDSN